jgi:hypothetical protein
LKREAFDQRRTDAGASAGYEDGTIFQVRELC